MPEPKLTLDGEVEQAAVLSYADLAALAAEYQIADVSRLDPTRKGDAVKLAGLLARVRPKSSARYVTLHASKDDFHASIPLDAVRDRAVLIYRLDGRPLAESAGGPLRFFIPDFAACHTSEIDECANVKFVDRLEFSSDPGLDNRPHDAAEHEALHDKEAK